MTAFPPASTPNSGSAPYAPAPLPPVPEARRNPVIVVWQRRWIVLSAILVTTAAAVVYLLQATPIYESSAKLYVQPNSPRIMSNDQMSMMMQSQNFLNTQASMITSYDLLSTVPDELRKRGRDINKMPTFADGTSVMGFLMNNVNAGIRRRDEDIITVSVRSPHYKDATLIANAVVDAFYTYHGDEQASNTGRILELLFDQKGKYDQELTVKRKTKLDFVRQNRIFATAGNPQNPTMDRLNKLSAALTEVELQALQAQAAYESTRAMMDDPEKIRQVLDTRNIRGDSENLRREFRELRKRFAGMSGQYLPNFPELNAIQSALKQVNEEMVAEDRRMIEAYLSDLRQRMVTAQAMEEQIRKHLQLQRAEVMEMNDITARYQILESEIVALEKASEAIDTRIKELSLTREAGPLNIKTVELARDNPNPVAPAKAQSLFYGMFGGLILGVMLAMMRDWMDQRLRSADEIKQVLNLPVLGVVPHINASSPSQRGLQLHLEPMSDVAESYRTVRTAVYFGGPSGHARKLLVTSPAPGDGKTTLASNLAVAMAQAGNRILLLDADFRKPMQHKIFEIAGNVGLSNVLAREAKLRQAIHNSHVPGLDVLPCGPIPANPSEILNSQMFADLLQELALEYDHVVLDSPPVVPVTDARILAASCDATVLALRAERSTRKAALYARDVLRGVGANILGIVVNDVPRRRGIYGYYYSDAYVYQYGYGRRHGGNGAKHKGNGAAVASSTPETADSQQR